MIRWCHKRLLGAVVKDVMVEYEEPKGIREFEIKR